jgi:hypothetical protein
VPTEYQEQFIRDVLSNRINRAILAQWRSLELKDGWLVAGCLFQTAWNLRCGRAPEAGIKDYDIFYFDDRDLSPEGEARVQQRVEDVLGRLDAPVEVKNQARVHLWYEEHFGYPYARLASSTDGIDRFLIPATCVGIRPTPTGYEVYAPNGLNIMYAGQLAPNPLVPHRTLFERKAASYKRRWDWLRVHAPLDAPTATLPR